MHGCMLLFIMFFKRIRTVVFICCVYLDFQMLIGAFSSGLLASNDTYDKNSKKIVKKIKNDTNRSIDEMVLFDLLRKKNADCIEIVIYTDYYCFACDCIHKEIQYLKSKIQNLKVYYEIVALSQESVNAAYAALYFKYKNKFDEFNDLMFKMDYQVRSVDRACAALGTTISDVLKFCSNRLELFREKIIANNKCLNEFSNGVAPLILIRLFDNGKKKLLKECPVSGDFSLKILIKKVEELVKTN